MSEITVGFPVGINQRCRDGVCYELKRSTNTLIITSKGDIYNYPKKRASYLINRFGLRKVKILEKWLLLLLIFSIILCGFYFLKEVWYLAAIFFLLFTISFFIEIYLNEVQAYCEVSRCKKCGRDFAYEEIEEPLIKKIITYSSYDRTVTRYFKCKYCNYEDLRIKTFLEKFKSKGKMDYKRKICKGCKKESTLKEYRDPDVYEESYNTERIIRHYKCISCGYIEISIEVKTSLLAE